ncbi:hypothetical protein NDU88_001654 [Pleurodeles waltl]|uniref:Uncharacterized protein n=1 Tax=Pleurodeles waltl TaxID=8319 RepID=A0AAV7NBD7_PLEWA|nr:hypothetical protein NDU88_001654 [Pleurodeles waltl]
MQEPTIAEYVEQFVEWSSRGTVSAVRFVAAMLLFFENRAVGVPCQCTLVLGLLVRVRWMGVSLSGWVKMG